MYDEIAKQQSAIPSGLIGAGIPRGYEATTGANCASPVPESPNVEGQLGRLHQDADYLLEKLDYLMNRLAPMLISAPECASKGNNLTARSGLGNVVASATGKVQRAAAMVNDMLERLDT